jgi:hypothetical protein
MQFILFLIVCYIIYVLYKNSQANNPYNIIDNNELRAYNFKKTFEANLESEIKMRTDQLMEKVKALKIKIPEAKKPYTIDSTSKFMKQMDVYNKEVKKNKNTKELKHFLDELYFLKDVIAPNFERNYIKLQTRYKTDPQKLIEISDDYRDWYYQQSRLYDPINYELWNDSSWENMDEARVILEELNSKLNFDMGWNKMSGYYNSSAKTVSKND